MRRPVVLLAAVACVGCAVPASASAHKLSVSKTKQVLYAYAKSQRALDFRIRYCRRRSVHHVRCIVTEVFVEPLFELHQTYDSTERYPMAVKARRRKPRMLIYDDIKDRWVRWSGRTS